MAFASVSGLVSGLDTATIINQLMQIEAQQQTMLKGRVTREQSAVTALQGLNSKLAAIATKAADLAMATGWSPVTASSTTEKVTATTGSAAQPGSLSFTVVQTARAHLISFSDTAALTDPVTTGSTFVTLTKADGTTVDVDTGDGTLTGLVNAVNNAGAGMRATTVRLDDGTYRLRVESTSTGQATSNIAVTNTDGTAVLGGATATVTGQDAKVTVGPDTISSTTNTFTGVLPGLDVTLAVDTPANTAVTVTVARDREAVTEAVKGLVDAVNEALAEVEKLTKYDAVSKKSGPLAGDSTLRDLRNDLVRTVTGAADGTSLAGYGVELDRSGRLTFDEATFSSAYDADPTAVEGAFVERTLADGSVVPGLLQRIESVADGASDSIDGTVTLAIKGRTSTIDSMQDAVDAWDTRLEMRRAALTRQFSALEVTLGQLQSQGSWLAGQIAGLPTMSSGQ